jgi:hypothetical protein
MRQKEIHNIRYRLKFALMVLFVFAGTTQSVCAAVGQGNHATRSTAEMIHRVAELETLVAEIEYHLNRFEAEKAQCELVRQNAQKALCEADLRDLYETARALYRRIDATATRLESEIALAGQQADPPHLEILDRMQKKVSLRRTHINRRWRSISNPG